MDEFGCPVCDSIINPPNYSTEFGGKNWALINCRACGFHEWINEDGESQFNEKWMDQLSDGSAFEEMVSDWRNPIYN